MPLADKIGALLARVSRACGFETVDAFPPGHLYARTHWNRAYFDIASDLKPEQIERSLCASIANTPTIFVYIEHPTPAMQRTLLGVIDTRLRHGRNRPTDLAALLIKAYASPHTMEALPGLRAAIESTAHEEMLDRVRVLLDFLTRSPTTFDLGD